MRLGIDQIIDSITFYLDDVFFPFKGYVVTLSAAESLTPVVKNPDGMFIYQASEPRWVYFDPHPYIPAVTLPVGTLTTAVISPSNHLFANYMDGFVAYDYDVVKSTGSRPTAQYSYKVIDYRSKDGSVTDEDRLIEFNPPAILHSLFDAKPSPISIGTVHELQERSFLFDIFARNVREKKVLRTYMAEAFSPRSKKYGCRIMDFDDESPLDGNGDKNSGFDWSQQNGPMINFRDKIDRDVYGTGAALAAQFRFHYEATAVTVE